MQNSAQTPQGLLLLSALEMVMGMLQHTKELVTVQRGQRGTGGTWGWIGTGKDDPAFSGGKEPAAYSVAAPPLSRVSPTHESPFF